MYRLARDLDSRSDLPGRELQFMQVHAFLGADTDTLQFVRFETRHRDADAVVTRDQVSESERAARIGEESTFLLREIAGQPNNRTHHGRSRAIRDCTEDL